MNDDWQWFLGLLAGVIGSAATVLIVAFRNVYQKISRGDGGLHKRIDEVKDDYVHKDHLRTHIDHLVQRMDDMRDESRSRHAELKDIVKDAMK